MYNDYKVKPLNILPPKKTKLMYFLIEDEKLLEKYTIWDKVSADIKKNLIASQSSIKNFLKWVTDEVTDFYDKGVPKVDCNRTCLAVISLDSALKKRWRLLSSSFFKRVFKYIEEKIVRHVHVNFLFFWWVWWRINQNYLGLCLKNYRRLFLKREMHTKKWVVVFKTTFTMCQYTWNYVCNPFKYKKNYTINYLNFVLDKVCL